MCWTNLAVLAAILLPVVGAGGVVSAQAPAGGVTAFEGARLIVGDGRAPIENGVLVVEGARIMQAGSAAEVSIPAGARRVSLAGKTLMPALIDTHTHLGLTRDDLTRDLQRRAYHGIGAAMSLGLDNTDAPFQIRAETPPGAARYFTAGRGITMPEPGRSDVPYWITTEAEGRKAVQELAAKKVDIVKVWVDDRDGKYKKLPAELYGPIIDEAHKGGFRVTAHIFALSDAKGLLRAGIDGFAHGVRDRDVDDEFMTLLKRHPNLVLTPNMGSRGVKTDLAWLKASLPAAEWAKLEAGNTDQPQAQTAFGIQARNLAEMNAAGARIATGTDGNTPWAPHVEMEDMVAAGMTPMQVIVASTRNAAEFLRIPDMGTLERGKSADFIVLDANPVDNITNTRRIASVYLRGVAVNRATYP